MNSDFEQCYQALKSRDHRFDGRFFVAVSSTGIYCRPVCPARLPKPENCSFFQTSAAAEQEGYRPCKRCRPELAPGLSCIDMPDTLLSQACRLVNLGFLDQHSVSELADRIGVSDRHLRRLFQAELGTSPLDIANSRRLLQARQLLRDTALPVTDIALLSGFKSIRSFNHLFRQYYHQTPGETRRKQNLSPDKPIRLQLGYRPPYDWQHLLNFLSSRIIPGVEEITDTSYRRAVQLETREHDIVRGWLEVSHLPEKYQLQVTLDPRLAPVIKEVLQKVRQLFDLDCNPAPILQTLGTLSESNPGTRLPGAFDGFEMSVRAILGQQVTVKAAHTLATRIARAFGSPLDTPFPGLAFTFPDARTIAKLEQSQLGELGIVRQRSGAILAIANAVIEDKLDLSPLADVPATLDKLVALKGIGPWTAQYIAMRALSWPDAFPDQDLGIIKALGTKDRKTILATSEKWRPWRAYAVMHLWESLSSTTPLPDTILTEETPA
ncbi:helix-turn-helix domain-containing protein [Sansalvadorimonas sp. 2012CJ34-2]|uniref:DNA-3-methyladenine glycosylase II n=1 Tax=Parendozoicomonas callyspongiae TaxID=2942213 RepID=A0ABT0PJP5_9GAMM|nr:DNA-3-methyladenine glycosylase 2 family protein [Sansalvadorimonas sp. 2012CJ34-2]MCL6271553.1 helix-turn-helix domain-containing protein [Sansalvadorimonas sp. 2012CJ34-2]